MFTLADVYVAAGQTPVPEAASLTIEAAHYDSRRIRPGMLFVALPGARVDGNDFISNAFAAGAVAALCGRPDPQSPSDRQVVTGDALRAFQRLAGDLRSRSNAAFVAVTGSNGKTTTKQAIAAALGAAGRTLATERSENTDIGVPTTLSRLRAEHRFAVIEMGAQVRGEIASYCAYARPDAGTITNIAGAHLEYFQSIEAVAEAKSELLAALPAGAPVVLNADDPWTPWLRARAHGPVTTFGQSPGAQIRVAASPLPDPPGTRVDLAAGDQRLRVDVPGVAGAMDLCFGAALAVAVGLGLDPATAVEGLRAFEPAPHRMQVARLPGGAVLIDDSYNANGASVGLALETLRAFPASGRRLAVLGDMLELGDHAPDEHREAGRRASFVDLLICVGSLARHLRDGAVEAGLPPDRVQLIDADVDNPEAVRAACQAVTAALQEALRPGDLVLLKASNGMGFAAIAEALASGARADEPEPQG